MVTLFDPSKQPLPLELADHRYSYPDGLKLKPGSHLHDFIRDMVIRRARQAYDRIKRRHDSWREMDRTVNGFIWADEYERRAKRMDPRKPVSLVVPMTYATLEAKMTYFSSTFLQYPYFRYAPQGPTSKLKALTFERVIDAQMVRAKAGLALHTQYRDNCLYGLGAGAVFWKKQMGKKLVAKPTGLMDKLLGRVASPRTVVDSMVWEGNEISNINPYFFLSDPTVGIQDIQKGEFVGWVSSSNYMSLLADERSNPEQYFNCLYLNSISGRSKLVMSDPSDRDRDNVSGTFADKDDESRPVSLTYMYVNLIPNEWGLGTYKYPQTWLFCLAGDEVVIMAQPLELTHNRFPVAVMSTGYSGYDASPVSSLEAIYGLQELMNFQLNSYVANMRKSVNDMIVADPSVINMYDLTHPGPGKVIRARRTAFNTDLRQAIFQLEINDITRNNIPDMMAVWRVAERASSINANLLGEQRNTAERVTATEASGEQEASLSRLEREFKIAGMQAMYDYAYIIGHQTQQFMSEATFISLVGRDEEILRQAYPEQESVLVAPDDLLMDFDVIPHDMRSLRKLDPQTALQLFQMASQNEQLATRYDIGKLFNNLSAQLGAEDIVLYQLPQAQVLPDQQVQQNVQAGNLVPIQQEGQVA